MIKKIFLKSEFSRNVLILTMGTAVSQAIPILISPILTRIYTPNEFGAFALFSSIVVVMAILVTLRYEASIMLPKDDIDAANLTILSIGTTFLIGFVFFLLFIFFREDLYRYKMFPEGYHWEYLIPVAIVVTGIYQSLRYWNNRKKNFKSIAYSQMTHSTGMSGIQVSLGLLHFGSLGFVIGLILGRIGSVLILMRRTWLQDKQIFTQCSKTKILENSKIYSDYPVYNALPSFLDSFTLQAPIFFITKSYEVATVGFLGLALRVLVAPAGLIGTSIGQVYYQKISQIANQNPDLLRAEMLRTARKLTMLSVIFFSPIFLIGEEIFGFVFGTEWAIAGKYSEMLCIVIFIRFIVSPLSTILGVTNNLKLGSIWKITYFICTIITLTIAINFDFDFFLMAYIINETLMYLLYFAIIYYASGQYSERTVK